MLISLQRGRKTRVEERYRYRATEARKCFRDGRGKGSNFVNSVKLP